MNKIIFKLTFLVLILFTAFSCNKNKVETANVLFDNFPSGSRPNAVAAFNINDCKWDKCELTFFLKADNSPSHINSDKIFKWAFNIWSVETGLTFTEVAQEELADIVISFQENDGPNNELGFSYFPCEAYGDRAGNISLDKDEEWTDQERNDNSQPIDLYTVAIHEIGHALGLEHTDVQEAIMWAEYKGSQRSLHLDDIHGIQNIYQCTPNNGNGGQGSGNPTGDIDYGLVASYSLEGNANDLSGNENHAIILGPTGTIDRFGNVNGAFHFLGWDPSDNPNRLEILNSNSLVFNNEFTFSIWAKVNDARGMNDEGMLANNYTFQTLFAKDFSIGKVHAGLDFNGEKVNIEFGDGFENARVEFDAGPFYGIWHHFVFSYNGSQLRIYLDGNLVKSTLTNIDLFETNQSNLIIGSHYYGEGGNGESHFWYPFYGGIDDIRVYNRAISDTEVLTIFQN